ncbi:hypothetical protein [Streptomyces lydicus]|uniref:hypothetical protein n=1 Tax=Streptomyces lydicus TaxID=47763 RepID=UPI001010681E|nr:hypothetical protein [Streptomyces lydicus]MCZ1012170.1 hypothetical protein [Streptomyces lydicus]
MPSENVVRQTTNSVARQTTSPEQAEAESNRHYAWQHLLTPQPPREGEWAGELAKTITTLRSSGLLSDVAAKYDQVTRLIERHAADETTETDLLAALLVIRSLRDKLQLDEGRIIGAARTKSVTWARVATALEMRTRQSAERRYLQLRTDLDDTYGDRLSQADRVDYYRSQRDRRAEVLWADQHQDEIVALARRLLAIPDLQQRADRSANASSINARAAELAARSGQPVPEPTFMPWPGRIAECLAGSTDATSPTPAGQKRMHMLFGLIGHAVDPGYIDLSDHDDIVRGIRQLYRDAGPAAPRVWPEVGRTPSSQSARSTG